MENVKINVSGSKIAVTSPYNEQFVTAARALGGKWQAPEWVFDVRDESRVRAICRELYGDDGLGAADLVTLRVVFKERAVEDRAPLSLCGRPLVRAWGRDSGAKLCDGVVLLQGSIDSGGSQKNWVSIASAGTILLVRDFPRAQAEALVEKDPEQYSIEPEDPVIDRAALIAERERLAARIAEIDQKLTGL